MSHLPRFTSWSLATSWTSTSSNRLWRRSTLGYLSKLHESSSTIYFMKPCDELNIRFLE